MKEHRIGAKIGVSLAIVSAVMVGIAPAAQARDSGWDTTIIVPADNGSDHSNGKK
jgi:hypothetical protein